MTKRPEEIALMAESGKLLADVFAYLDRLSLIGMSTMQVNDLVDSLIVNELNACPASKGQYGYAYALNTSRNHVVCHGVPSTADITLERNSYVADSSKTYLVGEVSPMAKRLVQVTCEAMWKGIGAVRPGARLGDVGHAIENGTRDETAIPSSGNIAGMASGAKSRATASAHWGKPRKGLMLQEGMVFTIEPMLNEGRHAVRTEDVGWTVSSRVTGDCRRNSSTRWP